MLIIFKLEYRKVRNNVYHTKKLDLIIGQQWDSVLFFQCNFTDWNST